MLLPKNSQWLFVYLFWWPFNKLSFSFYLTREQKKIVYIIPLLGRIIIFLFVHFHTFVYHSLVKRNKKWQKMLNFKLNEIRIYFGGLFSAFCWCFFIYFSHTFCLTLVFLVSHFLFAEWKQKKINSLFMQTVTLVTVFILL